MAVSKEWTVVPDSDFTDRDSWRSLGNNRYAALRVHILFVRSDGQPTRLGPVIEEHNVPAKQKIELKRKREQVNSRTETISQAIRFATSSRVCDQLASKISSELSSHLPGYSGKLSAETLSKSEYEITQTTEQVLTGTTSHLVQQVEGQELTFQLTAENDDRVAQLRRRYFPFRWDVYLHSFEYLELTYGRKVPRLWKQVRETIKQSSDVLGWPLISVTFYEPQVDPNVFLTPVPDALGDPDAILISELNDTMPRSTLPDRESLNELAKLAFPVTKEEKSRAVGRPRKRAAMKRAAPKRAAKKRAAPKRAAKKRAAKKK